MAYYDTTKEKHTGLRAGKEHTMKTAITLEEKKDFIREHNLSHLVRELNIDHSKEGAEAAIEMVYDQKTMTKEDYRMKYFGF